MDQDGSAEVIAETPPADRLARGVLRHLHDLGFVGLTEFRLRNGRRVDVVAVDRKGRIVIIEIKRSRADFVSDQKWIEYLEYCDLFYFAIPENFDLSWLPLTHGVIRCDAYGAEIIRPAAIPDTKLPPARRRDVTLRFARTAASRLRDALDADSPVFDAVKGTDEPALR